MGLSLCILLQDSHSQLTELQHTSPSRGTKQQHLLLPQRHEDSAEEFKFTLAAARRTELRRLRSFVKMADYMMCDTLQQVCMAPCHIIHTTDSLAAMLSRKHDLACSCLHTSPAAVLSECPLHAVQTLPKHSTRSALPLLCVIMHIGMVCSLKRDSKNCTAMPIEQNVVCV